MLQRLLETRFNLTLRRETKEVPVYLLTVTKGGVKAEPTKAGSCVQVDIGQVPPQPAPGQPRPEICGNQGMTGDASRIVMTVSGMTMAQWAAGALSRFVDRPIIDKTGLDGLFDIHLEFAPDSGSLGLQGRGGADSALPPPTDPLAPPIFAALPQQLGLRLDPGRGPVDVLVIDHVDRPSEN